MGRSQRNPVVVVGGLGCVLLLCVGLVAAGALFVFDEEIGQVVAQIQGGDPLTPVETVPVTEPISPVATSEPTATLTSTPVPATTEPTATMPPTPEGSDAPKIGMITFGPTTTDDYTVIDAGREFEQGITEIHAVFDYSDMSPDYEWERVWYLDGEEILRNTAQWTGDRAGRFDYYIDAAGEPLSPGNWRLELYVEDELRSVGEFVIVPEGGLELAQVGDSSTPQALDEDENTPTATPTLVTASQAGATREITATPTRRINRTYDLAFTRWDGGKHNLYIANTNGGEEQFLISRAAGPSWTPDGNNIFFFGEQAIDRQIIEGIEYNFDGISDGLVSIDVSPVPQNISEVQLYQGLDWKQGRARWANVSPNGEMVAFDSNHSGNYRIYFLGTADSGAFRNEIIGEQGDWSPDSERIVYRSGRDGRTGLWISNRNDTGHVQLTENGSDSFPAWSPDGDLIAFSREVDGNVDIYTIEPDGTNLERLTDAVAPDTLPTFAPDGTIIFRSARNGWGIWKMDSDGNNQEEIIPNAPVGPDWSYSRMDVN